MVKRFAYPSAIDRDAGRTSESGQQNAEQQRIAVRNIRRDAMEHLKLEKEHGISEDEHKRYGAGCRRPPTNRSDRSTPRCAQRRRDHAGLGPHLIWCRSLSLPRENPRRVVAIIMDGNGRWARQRNRPRPFGHAEGVEALRRTVEAAGELGVEYLTVFGFSTENWRRPAEEVSALFDLLRLYVARDLS